MTASITFYNNWKAAVNDAALRAATVKVTLHTSTYTFAATHNTYSDLTNELSTANGYTNGGQALSAVSWSQTSGTATFTASNLVWTATSSGITARRAVIRVVGTFNSQVDPLVASILLDTTPADVTAAAGNTLTLQWNGSGIFTLA